MSLGMTARRVIVFAAILCSFAPGLLAQSFSNSRVPAQGRPDDAPSLFKPLHMFDLDDSYAPISGRDRLRWFITSTIGPQRLAAGLFSSAFGTGLDRPKEYGPHWGGYADRYGMGMTGIATGNAMEAGLGAIWGEDPRYFRDTGDSVGGRVRNIAKQTFVARYRDGAFHPAYARFAAVAGNNFLSNTWREPGESNAHDAVIRTTEGIGGRMAGNAFQEFWPEIKKYVFRRGG